MGAAIRFLAMLAVCALLSAVMVLVITARMLGTLAPEQIALRWARLADSGQPVAALVRQEYGLNPPEWVRQLALTWQEADLASWWWLPLLFMGVGYVAMAFSRRRNRPSALR